MPLPAELVPYEIEPLPELRKDRYGEFVLKIYLLDWIGLDWIGLIDMGRLMDALNSPCKPVWVSRYGGLVVILFRFREEAVSV